jgi:cyclic pyranopterin phosphate synthase
MANILLTNKCIRACPYCFAGKEMALSSRKDFISWENIVYLADFLQASGEKHLSLLGGEPAIHPQFVDILLYLIDRGFGVTTFTSGVMSTTTREELEKGLAGLLPDKAHFVCNINNPSQTPAPKSENEQVHAFLSGLGAWTMPGFNIYRKDFDLEFIFDLIGRYGLKKRLRLGLAHPIPGSENEFIRAEDIGAVIERLYSYRDLFNQLHVRPNFDCGFPLCRVTDEQLGWLARLSGRMNFICNPAIDITPDMQVYCCFPLASLNKKSLFEFDSFKAIVAYYRNLQACVRGEIGGIYEECATCVHRAQEMCAGGGACQLVKRMADEAPETILDIVDAYDKAYLPERTGVA